MLYKVVLHRTDEGISVSVPGLPGCWSEGDTEGEALDNTRDAIREYMAATNDRAYKLVAAPSQISTGTLKVFDNAPRSG